MFAQLWTLNAIRNQERCVTKETKEILVKKGKLLLLENISDNDYAADAYEIWIHTFHKQHTYAIGSDWFGAWEKQICLTLQSFCPKVHSHLTSVCMPNMIDKDNAPWKGV